MLLIDQPILIEDVIILKCLFKRSISFIYVLLLIISTISFSACGQKATPTESTDTTPDIIGEWRCHTEYDFTAFIFHKDMSFELIIGNADDSTLISHERGIYTVNDNLITATYNTYDGNSMNVEITYNPDDQTLSSFDGVFTFITNIVDDPRSIVGTWKPLYTSEYFYFHTTTYYDASITLFQDGSFAIVNDTSNDLRTSGSYNIVHDGDAIQFNNFGGTSSKTMQCTPLSEDLLYIKSRDGHSTYYIWTRID